MDLVTAIESINFKCKLDNNEFVEAFIIESQIEAGIRTYLETLKLVDYPTTINEEQWKWMKLRLGGMAPNDHGYIEIGRTCDYSGYGSSEVNQSEKLVVRPVVSFTPRVSLDPPAFVMPDIDKAGDNHTSIYFRWWRTQSPNRYQLLQLLTIIVVERIEIAKENYLRLMEWILPAYTVKKCWLQREREREGERSCSSSGGKRRWVY
ncbi:hypothetical protein LXL04_030164 [Taraxacum kok-saghyz]